MIPDMGKLSSQYDSMNKRGHKYLITHIKHGNFAANGEFSIEEQRIGIYGWRKRCLYILILITIFIVFVNIGLTLWLILSLNFNYNGLLNNVHFTKTGLKLVDQTVVLDELITSKISASNSNLDIYSDKAIRFFSRNKDNSLQNSLIIGNDSLKLFCDNFTIIDNRNRTIFSITKEKYYLSTDSVEYGTKERPVKFQSLTTKNIKSNDNINIASLNGSITLDAKNLTLNGSSLLKINSKNNLVLSANKKIVFQTEEIKLVRLPEVQATNRRNDLIVNEVMQLCLCKSGLLYAQHSNKPCADDGNICKD